MGVHKTFGGAFKAMYRQLSSVQSSLPRVIANEGTKFFVSNFQLEGFTNVGFDHWQPRKPTKKINRKKILVRSGRLRRAVNNSNTERNFKRVVWRISKGEVPYAAVHNEGANGIQRVKSHDRGKFKNEKVGTGVYSVKTKKERKKTVTTKVGSSRVLNFTRRMNIPKRKFMGQSEFLNRRFRLRIKQAYIKAFG